MTGNVFEFSGPPAGRLDGTLTNPIETTDSVSLTVDMIGRACTLAASAVIGVGVLSFASAAILNTWPQQHRSRRHVILVIGGGLPHAYQVMLGPREPDEATEQVGSPNRMICADTGIWMPSIGLANIRREFGLQTKPASFTPGDSGRRGITPSTGLRLAKALGTTPQFWLNGQLALDLYRASHDEEELRQLERIEPISR